MRETAATRDQVVALHALYAQWTKHALGHEEDKRAARLAWASESTGRRITSFSDLDGNEVSRLIDGLKGAIGQATAEHPQPWRPIGSREAALAAGTGGRKNADASVIQMAGPDDLARIDEAIERLGWTRNKYEKWLRSRVSPVGAEEKPVIRTVAQANKVWWALKNMLKRSGKWRPQPRKRPRQTSGSSV